MSLYPRSSISTPPGISLTRSMAAILLLWILQNAYFLLTRGMVSTGEAAKYIYQAQFFTTVGHPETTNFWLYFFPIAILSLCLKWQLGFGWMIVLQLLVNLWATLYFFRTVTDLLGSRKTAIAATVLLLLNFPYQAYNTFLQTESLFQSGSLLLSCYILSRKEFTLRSLLIILAGLLLISITRPNGLIYWPIVCTYLIFFGRGRIKPLYQAAFLILSLSGSLLLLNAAMGSGGELDFMLPFREEHIICGTPTLFRPAPIHTAGTGNSLYSLFYYATHNTAQFSRLALLKTISFWSLFRPYFSFGHNLYLVLYFYPVTIMSLLAIRLWWRSARPAFLFLSGPVCLTWLIVVLSCDDWHNRIFLGISPYLLFISLPFLRKWLDKGSGSAKTSTP